MQQSAQQQPPVAMYVVHYLQPHQGQPSQIQQQQMIQSVPMPQQQQQQPGQPQMWGPYPQAVPCNGMPMQIMPYHQYMSLQQAQAMQAQMQCLPRGQSQTQDTSTDHASPCGSLSSAGQQNSAAAIPGPVQPLQASATSPGPPGGDQAATMAAAAALVKIQPSASSLADFATVASMQRSEVAESISGSKRKLDSSAGPQGVFSGESPVEGDEQHSEVAGDSRIPILSSEFYASSSGASPGERARQKWRRYTYKRRNFPVEVEICLPRSKSKAEANTREDESGATNTVGSSAGSSVGSSVSSCEGTAGTSGAAGETTRSVNDKSAEPAPAKSAIRFVPGLPETPRAVMNPVQLPEPAPPRISGEGTTEAGDSKKSPDQEEHEEVIDEDVVWMEDDDPTKRRKRSSNVFDEVLTMNPQYTPEGFVCPECYKVFKFRKHCRRHMVNHSGSKPFKCPKCPRSYTRKDTCQRHAAACRVKSANSGFRYAWNEAGEPLILDPAQKSTQSKDGESDGTVTGINAVTGKRETVREVKRVQGPLKGVLKEPVKEAQPRNEPAEDAKLADAPIRDDHPVASVTVPASQSQAVKQSLEMTQMAEKSISKSVTVKEEPPVDHEPMGSTSETEKSGNPAQTPCSTQNPANDLPGAPNNESAIELHSGLETANEVNKEAEETNNGPVYKSNKEPSDPAEKPMTTAAEALQPEEITQKPLKVEPVQSR